MCFASSQRLLSAIAVMVMAALVPATATAQTGGIAGTVTSGPTPLAGVQVQIYNSSETFVTTAVPTSASGAYSVTGLAPGTYYAFAYAGNVSGGYVDTLYPNTGCIGSPNPSSFDPDYCEINTGGQIQVSAGNTTTGIDFDLPVGGMIAGTITAAGSAYANTLAELHLDLGGPTSYVRTSTVTSANGAYQLGRLPAGTYYVWAGNVTGASATGYVPELFDGVPCPKGSYAGVPASGIGCSLAAATPIIVSPGSVSNATFDLQIGGAISGRILGSGLPRPYLTAYAGLMGSSLTSISASGSRLTGNYLLTGLAAGTHIVSGSGLGYEPQQAGQVVVSAGAIAAGPTIDLQPGPPYVDFAYARYPDVISGQSTTLSVTAYGAAPLAYQWYLGNQGDTTNPIPLATGRDYTTPALTVATNYWVRVSNLKGIADTGVAVTIAAPGTGSISGTVTSGAQPVGDVFVNIYSSTGQFYKAAPPTSASGAFSVAGLGPGTYYAFASAGAVSGNVTMGSLVASADYPYTDLLYPNVACAGLPTVTGNYCRFDSGTLITVGANAVTSGVDFNLPIGGTITGTLTANGAIPNQTAGAAVSVIVDAPGPSRVVATGHVDPLGTLVLGRLPAGQYRIMASAAGMTSEVWDDVQCPGFDCLGAGGTPIDVPAAGLVTGRNFDLATAPLPPTIVTQPQYQGINSGQSATLTVEAAGQGPLFYQWYLGTSGSTGAPIAGATSSSYATPPLTTATNYWVRVSNYGGSVNSTTVTVEVNVGGFWRPIGPGGGGSGSGGGTVGPLVPPGGGQSGGSSVAPVGGTSGPSRAPVKRGGAVRRPPGR